MDAVLRTASSKQELGGSPKIRLPEVRQVNSINWVCTTLNYRWERCFLVFSIAYCGQVCDNKYAVDEDRNKAPPPVLIHQAGADPEQRM